MCEVCDKIRRARFNYMIYETDLIDKNSSHTSPVYDEDDVLYMKLYKNTCFCPKCGNKI